MAGLLGPGSTTTLGYASRLTVGIASLLVGSFSPVFLHQFSRFVAAKDVQTLRSVYSSFVAFAPWLGACMTVGTWLLSGVVAPLFYQHGSFTADDARVVARIIDAYAFQFPFFLTCTVGFTLISALGQTHVFIRLNAILLVSNLVADVLLMRYLGLPGLALATAIVYAISLLSLNIYLWREGSARPDAHSIRGALLALASAGVAGAVIRYFDLQLTPSSPTTAWLGAVLVIVAMVTGALLYNWPRIVAYRQSRAALSVRA
jgi:putative peptidoglycan lipid II flippase